MKLLPEYLCQGQRCITQALKSGLQAYIIHMGLKYCQIKEGQVSIELDSGKTKYPSTVQFHDFSKQKNKRFSD